MNKKQQIYTDGGHKGKWGSWAFVIVRGDKIVHERSGRVRNANSHRMEFQAAIEALSFLKKNCRATVFSDSKILIDCMKLEKKRPAVYADQIDQLDLLSTKHSLSWAWVKAHSGILHNERCYQLCTQARNG